MWAYLACNVTNFFAWFKTENFSLFVVKIYCASPNFKMWGTHSLSKRQKKEWLTFICCAVFCVWAHVLSSVMTTFTISGLFMLFGSKIINFGHFFSLLKFFSLVEFQFRILLIMRCSGSPLLPLGLFFQLNKITHQINSV